jgi:hypothetical protein
MLLTVGVDQRPPYLYELLAMSLLNSANNEHPAVKSIDRSYD